MNRSFRNLLLIIGIVQGIVGIAFALRVPIVSQLWLSILPGATPLSLSFVGSIFAAAGASTVWCLAIANEDAAVTGLTLDYLTILIPVSIFAFQLASAEGGTPLLIFAVACVVGVILGAILFSLTRKIPYRHTQPPPLLVRVSFGIFVVALVFVGGQMVLKVPGVTMPWPISTNESVIYGWMFLGAAAYFAYGLLKPAWGNAGGQLAGFLAYDLVLIFPFIARFGSGVPPQFMTGHIIYTVVVTLSGLLAIYYLFINPQTRMIGQRAQAQPST